MTTVAETPEDAPPETQRLARRAQSILRRMTEAAPPQPPAVPPVGGDADAA